MLLSGTTATAAKKKNQPQSPGWSTKAYEIETFDVGVRDTKSVKVWGEGKNVILASEDAKRNAVAAAIFAGFPPGGSAAATPPLASNPGTEARYADFFESFFADGGEYLQFIKVTTDGVASGRDRIKVKNGYKVGLYLVLAQSDLRKRLEEAGVITSLGEIFD